MKHYDVEKEIFNINYMVTFYLTCPPGVAQWSFKPYSISILVPLVVQW